MRVWAAVALSVLLLLPVLVLGPSAPPPLPPAAVAAVAAQGDGAAALLPPARVEPDFRDAVYGDLLVVGNGVLRCPTDNTGESCLAATANAAPADASGSNNGYAMALSGGPDSFAASSAELTVPAGARVRYAQLNWGGHTGSFLGFSGVNCVRPLLAQSQPPPAPAAARPSEQDVRLAVAGGPAATVPRVADHFRLTAGLIEPSQMYTDWAEVTDRFAAAPTGAPFTVDVSDVWVPSGPGCAGGWSLVVVFDYGGPAAAYPTPRVVDVYSGTLPQGGALVPGLLEPLVPGFPSVIDALLPNLVPDLGGTHVVLAGPSRARGDVTLGLTAFDGDWRQGGETFAVDGVPVDEPCLRDGTADFFRSCAVGAVDGDRRPTNNLSVDAKTVRLSLPANNTGDIDIGVDGIDDFVVMQNVALSEPVDPGIGVTVTGPTTPVREGDLVELAVNVTNTGSLPLTHLTLTGTDDPIRCAPAVFAPLEPGTSTTATCVVTARVGAATHQVTATGTYLVSSGGEGRTVSATGQDDTVVLPAEYTVSRVPDRLTVHAGEPVEFAVTLTNNTDGDLTGVTYTDSAPASCTAAPAVLTARSTATLRCTVPATTATFDSDGVLTGTDATGTPVTVRSQTVTVMVIDPTVTLTQSVAPDVVYRGQPVAATFTVTNTGTPADGPLFDLRVAADLPGCVPRPLPVLEPGKSATLSCTGSPVATTVLAATVAATDGAATPVTATADPVTITVLAPLIAITQSAAPTSVRAGDPVEFTFTVTHVGTAEDGPLHQVRITSPTLPPACVLEEIAQLVPGESQTRTCSATPDRSFTNLASVAALDGADRMMTADADPLPTTVLNPALVVSVAANPDRAQHGADVDFEVTLRNTGNVDLSVQVTNDKAADCDLTLPALAAGAAHGVRCTVRMPADESTAELTNDVSYTARPVPAAGDPLTGTETATVTLLAGQAPDVPTPGPDPTDPHSGADAGSGSGSGGGATGAKNTDKNDGLAFTGAVVLVPLVLGAGLVVLGAVVIVGARRRKRGQA